MSVIERENANRRQREIHTDLNQSEIVRRLRNWAAIASQGGAIKQGPHHETNGNVYAVLHDAANTIDELRSRLSSIVMFSYDEFARLDDLLYNGKEQDFIHTLLSLGLANRGFHAESRTKPTITPEDAGRWANASEEAVFEIQRLRGIIEALHLHLVDKYDVAD